MNRNDKIKLTILAALITAEAAILTTLIIQLI